MLIFHPAIFVVLLIPYAQRVHEYHPCRQSLCFHIHGFLIVLQYPLSNLVKEEANDGREKGVAVIVSINKQRNDAWKLPEDILDKAELQVSDLTVLTRLC